MTLPCNKQEDKQDIYAKVIILNLLFWPLSQILHYMPLAQIRQCIFFLPTEPCSVCIALCNRQLYHLSLNECVLGSRGWRKFGTIWGGITPPHNPLLLKTLLIFCVGETNAHLETNPARSKIRNPCSNENSRTVIINIWRTICFTLIGNFVFYLLELGIFSVPPKKKF